MRFVLILLLVTFKKIHTENKSLWRERRGRDHVQAAGIRGTGTKHGKRAVIKGQCHESPYFRIKLNLNSYL